MRTCRGNSRSVRLIEATIVRGYVAEALPRSFWTIKAGLVPCCSAPRPGDQFTSQISPRLGLGAWGGVSLCFDSAELAVGEPLRENSPRGRSTLLLSLGLGDDCLASLLMLTTLCDHTLYSDIKKEACIFECFWDGTEVGVSFVEGAGNEGEFAFAFLDDGLFQLLIIVLLHEFHNCLHYIA